MMDYSIHDSSIRQNPEAYAATDRMETALRVGVVKSREEVDGGQVRYIVECVVGGVNVPVSCRLLNRFGGVYNYEEFRPKTWADKIPDASLIPTTNSTYDLLSGDMVVVGFLNGKSREAVILGGLKHEAREEVVKDDIEYVSVFNGLETKIDKDGAYTITFQGTPINADLLDIPGVPITSPIYNELIAGTMITMDNTGSILLTDGNDTSITITKDVASPKIELKSGDTVVTLNGQKGTGSLEVSTNEITLEAKQKMSIAAKLEMSVETTQLKLKGQQVAIGNDTIELIDGLIQLIDAIGASVVTSPVGTCTPLMAAPTWASQVIPLKVKLTTIKGSL